MSRKNFKDSTAHLDQFFSAPPAPSIKPDTPEAPEVSTEPEKHTAPEVSAEPKALVAPEEYHRLNIKIKMKYKKYLDQVSWENRKSVTKFICDLIQTDMETRGK